MRVGAIFEIVFGEIIQLEKQQERYRIPLYATGQRAPVCTTSSPNVQLFHSPLIVNDSVLIT